MELEDFRNVWQASQPENRNSTTYSETELALMMQSKAKDPISRIRRNARLEHYATIAFIPLTLAAAFVYPTPEIRFGAIVLFVFCIVFVAYYSVQLKSLDRIATTDNVRETLEKLYQNFGRYVKVYRIVYRTLIPVFFLAGAVLGGQLLLADNMRRLLYSPLAIAIIIVALGLSVFLCDKALTWYIGKLYGRHFSRLKQILDSFGQE